MTLAGITPPVAEGGYPVEELDKRYVCMITCAATPILRATNFGSIAEIDAFAISLSVAICIFEGQMRKMADGFQAVRIAELEACTSGFHGQISDMAAYGAASHGKEEQRKEMSLIAMAHRGTFRCRAPRPCRRT